MNLILAASSCWVSSFFFFSDLCRDFGRACLSVSQWWCRFHFLFRTVNSTFVNALWFTGAKTIVGRRSNCSITLEFAWKV